MSLSAPLRVLNKGKEVGGGKEGNAGNGGREGKEDEVVEEKSSARRSGFATTTIGNRRASIGFPQNINSENKGFSATSVIEKELLPGRGSAGAGTYNNFETKEGREGGRDDISGGTNRLGGAVRTTQTQFGHSDSTSTVPNDSSGPKRLPQPPARDIPLSNARGVKMDINDKNERSGRVEGGGHIDKTDRNERNGTNDGASMGEDMKYTLENLKMLCEDSLWSTRLKGFEILLEKLTKISLKRTEKNEDSSSSAAESGLGSRDFSATMSNIEVIVDLSVSHLGDAHQKVAVEALSVLSTCVMSFTNQTVNKLGALLAALFNRLADRRAQIKYVFLCFILLLTHCFILYLDFSRLFLIFIPVPSPPFLRLYRFSHHTAVTTPSLSTAHPHPEPREHCPLPAPLFCYISLFSPSYIFCPPSCPLRSFLGSKPTYSSTPPGAATSLTPSSLPSLPGFSRSLRE